METAAERVLDAQFRGVDRISLRQGAARVFRRALDEAGAVARAVAAPDVGGIGQMQAFAPRKAARVAQHEIVILRALEAFPQPTERRQAVATIEGEMVRVVHAGQQRRIEGGLQEKIDRPQTGVGYDFVRVEKKARRRGGEGAPNPIERERRERVVVIEKSHPRRVSPPRRRRWSPRQYRDLRHAAGCANPAPAAWRSSQARVGSDVEPSSLRINSQAPGRCARTEAISVSRYLGWVSKTGTTSEANGAASGVGSACSAASETMWVKKEVAILR